MTTLCVKCQLGRGAAEGVEGKSREKNFSASTAFAASEGWKASQNT